MKATTWRLLLGLAVVFGVLSWAVLRVWTGDFGGLPDVPWATAVVIGSAGLVVLGSAVVLRPRLRGKEGSRRVEPLVSARFAVLSLASSRAGASFIGVYGGFLAIALMDLDVDFHRHVAIVAALCVLASGLLMAAGLVLERICRLPPTDKE